MLSALMPVIVGQVRRQSSRRWRCIHGLEGTYSFVISSAHRTAFVCMPIYHKHYGAFARLPRGRGGSAAFALDSDTHHRPENTPHRLERFQAMMRLSTH